MGQDGVLPDVHSREPTTSGTASAEENWMDKGAGFGESGAEESPEIQFCNLVAQGQKPLEGSIQTRGGEGVDRGRQRALESCLF